MVQIKSFAFDWAPKKVGGAQSLPIRSTEDCWLHKHLPHLSDEEDEEEMNKLDLSHSILDMKVFTL